MHRRGGTTPQYGPSPLRRSLNRALLAVFWGALLTIGMLVVAIAPNGDSVYGLLLFPVAVLLHVAVGLLAWSARPTSLMGPLILCAAAAMTLSGLVNAQNTTLAALGALCATVPLATLIHLLLSFPTGRLRAWPERATVASGYLISTVLQLPAALTAYPAVFGLAPPPAFVTATGQVQAIAGVMTFTATAVLLVLRIVRATAAERRVLAPLYAFGFVALITLLTASQVLPALAGWTPEQTGSLQITVLTLVPIAVVIAALRGGVARATRVEEAGVLLAHLTAERTSISAVLGSALGDPSLDVWFWDADAERYLDADGRAVGTEHVDPRRALEPIALDGRRIGALVYDRALIAEPESVQSVGRAIAIALDRDRLIALLRASRADLQRSRERLVDVADTERRRIAQDLHDGLQVELVLLGLQAQELAQAAGVGTIAAEHAVALRRGIDGSAAGLRQIVQDVMPAALMQRGLAEAVEDLVDRMPVPVELRMTLGDRRPRPATESTVYFVIAEALANVVKHSGATAVDVTVVRDGDRLSIEIRDDGCGGAVAGAGAGLTGMRERVDVLGGMLRVDSPRGGGTLVRVEVDDE